MLRVCARADDTVPKLKKAPQKSAGLFFEWMYQRKTL